MEEGSEKITHARVKFISDDLKVTVPIEDIVEFENKPPVDAKSFSRTTIYTCWYEDAKNPERHKYGVIIGCLGDETSIHKKRANFAKLDQSVIEEYNKKSTDGIHNSSLSSLDSEKETENQVQKKKHEKSKNDQRLTLQLKVEKLTNSEIYKSPVTRSHSKDKLLNLSEGIDSSFNDNATHNEIQADNNTPSIRKELTDSLEDVTETNTPKTNTRSIFKKHTDLQEDVTKMNTPRNNTPSIKKKLTALEEELDVTKIKYQKLLLEHNKVMKENEKLIMFNFKMQEMAFNVGETSKGGIATSTPKLKNADISTSEATKKKKVKSCSYMEDVHASKRKFGEKFEEDGEKVIYLRHGYSVPREKWRKMMTSKTDRKFCKEIFRCFYKDEEIVKKCIVEDERRLTPNGKNKRVAVTPERTDAIRKALEYYTRENSKDAGIEMSETALANVTHKARVQKILTEEICDKIKRARKQDI